MISGAAALIQLVVNEPGNVDDLWRLENAWLTIEQHATDRQLSISDLRVEFSFEGGEYVIFRSNNSIPWDGEDRIQFALVDCYYDEKICELVALEYKYTADTQ